MSVVLDYTFENIPEIAKRLNNGEVGIFPCDTIYGICAKVGVESAERIYEIKERPQSKSFIHLMTKDQLLNTDLIVPEDLISRWPNPFTAILANEKGETTALRVPNDEFLMRLLPLSGPIFSTSVNISGQPSLQDLDEIVSVFSDRVDFIVGKKNLKHGMSSTLIDATKKPYHVIRQGAYKF